MKKLLAILSGVAMLFASCEKSGDEKTPKPNFPALQEVAAESGSSYEFTFTVDKDWSLALTEESRLYATMVYDGFEDFQCSGVAGEHTVVVKMQSGLFSYTENFVATLEMTIEGITETVAVYTIPHKTYTVTGAAPDGNTDVISTISEGGHPENGPFADAPNLYTVYYLSQNDAVYGDFVVSHDIDFKFQYELYAKGDSGEFEKVPSNKNGWLGLSSFDGGKSFKLKMNVLHSSAVKSEGVGYEAYVNMVNEQGETIVSVYYIYDPNAVVEIKTSLTLANPELAAEKGVTLTGEGMAYTLTLPSPELIGEGYEAAMLKLEGYSEFYGGIGSGLTNLTFVKDMAAGLCYVKLSEGASLESLFHEDILNISGLVKGGGGLHEYVVTLVFDWVTSTLQGEKVQE